MVSPKRILSLAGALLVGVLPQAVAAQGAQVGALEVALKRSASFDAPTDSVVRIYGRSHALVIGINTYSGRWQPRSSAISDAQAVATSLKRLGFAVNQVLDPDQKQLSSSFEEFLRGPGSARNSRLVIWFSGQAVTQDGKAHLLSMSRRGQHGSSGLATNSVSLDQVSRQLRAARAKHVLSAFDACFSHSGFAMARSARAQSITSRTVKPVRQIITSCDADQVVSDSGKFRQLFLDALMGRAKVANLNKDDYLTGTELGLYLADRLSSLTENLQTPTFGKMRYAGLDRGDMVFKFPPEAMTLPRQAAHSPDVSPTSREPEPRLVQKIQRRLSHLGCYSGGIDGQWGRGTSRAIEQINTRRSMNPPLITARADQATLDRLRKMSDQVCPVIARLPSKPERTKPPRKSRKRTEKPRYTAKVRRSKTRRAAKPVYIPKTRSRSRRKSVTMGVGF